MTLRSVLKFSEKFIIDNSPAILSAIAVTGSIATAYLTGKATFKAAEIIQGENLRRDLHEREFPELTKKDRAKLVWKEYIPPAIVLAGTIGSIVMANHISASRLAALAGAYKLSEKQFAEYKDKVVEKLGTGKEKALRDEANQEYARNNPPSDDIQIFAGEDEVIFCEKWTGRWFRSKLHVIKAAENKINYMLFNGDYATLSDFYDFIGLEHTQESSEVGWSIENPIELDITTSTADGGSKPCFIMEYSNRPQPIRDYHRVGLH